MTGNPRMGRDRLDAAVAVDSRLADLRAWVGHSYPASPIVPGDRSDAIWTCWLILEARIGLGQRFVEAACRLRPAAAARLSPWLTARDGNR
jgi:hypothetical protein